MDASMKDRALVGINLSTIEDRKQARGCYGGP